MTTARRQHQIAERLHEELSLLVPYQLQDPRLTSVTVTGVEISSDLRNATVYVSVPGSEAEAQAAMAGLRHAAGFLCRELGETLTLRAMPQLAFQLDRSVQNSMRIEQLLDSLKTDEPETGDGRE